MTFSTANHASLQSILHTSGCHMGCVPACSFFSTFSIGFHLWRKQYSAQEDVCNKNNNRHTNMNKIWVSGHFAHSYFATGHFTPYFIGGHFASIHVLWWTFRSPNKLTSFPRRCLRVGKKWAYFDKKRKGRQFC